MGLHTTNPPPTSPAHGPNRYETLPATAAPWPDRYKTLPARPKTPKSGHFKRAGRIFSRFHHHATEQGEFSPASTTNPPLTRYKTLPATAAPGPNRYKTLPATAAPGPNRYKTLPATAAPGPNRYKTLPARPRTGPTGTKLSRHAQKHRNPAISSAQGELFPGSTTTTPSRENFFPVPPPIHHSPGKKLSRQQPPPGPTGTKLSPHAHPLAQPVQNSPSTPKNTEIRPFLASRENFLPVPPPRNRAGRTFSRFHHHLGAYFNAADRLVPTFTRAPDQCAPELGIVRVIGCSSRCSSRTRRD